LRPRRVVAFLASGQSSSSVGPQIGGSAEAGTRRSFLGRGPRSGSPRSRPAACRSTGWRGGSEPFRTLARTRGMTRRLRLLLLAIALVAVTTTALLGGSASSPPAVAAPASEVVDVGALLSAFSAGDSAAVVRRLERDVAAGPADPTLRTLVGLGYQQLFRETGDADWLSRARDSLEHALSLGATRDRDTLAGLAQVSATQHRFREAERHARAALRVAPGHPTALGALADALVELGRYEEAFAVIDRIAFQGPSVAGYARVARARELLGRADGALEAMELAIEAGSGIPEQEAWALSRYGELLLAGGDADGAADAFRRSLSIQPAFPHARAGLAKVDLADGRPAAAIRRLEALLATVPSAEYAVELGDAYLAESDPARAAAAYRRAHRFHEELARNGVRTMLASAALDLDLGSRLPSALVRARQAYREAPNVETLGVLA
jgi:tetratricopeptide (TPR) repeat protein